MAPTKDRILSAAEELISANGIADATITKIANRAEVADSLVYQYFKNKQDLLFSVASLRLEEALELLDEQLEGIRDPESMLRKLIWYGLRYNDRNPGYTKILLECRSNKDFYTTGGYKNIRKHAGKMLDILETGVADGLFRNDINMDIVRDAIYGVLDFEAVDCIATKEIQESHTDLDDIMALILPMIKVKPQAGEEDKRTRILFAAEKCFAEHGFNKAKITDIAEKANVAEGTIYDYFKNKDDLLLSIPETRLSAHLAAITETFDVKTNCSRLRRLIRHHFAFFMINRDFLKIFLLHIQPNIAFYQSKAYDVYKKYLDMIDHVVIEGKKSGEFRPEVNSRVFRNLLFGAFSHMALRWTIVAEDQDSDKMKEIDQLIDLVLDAVSAQGEKGCASTDA